MFTKPKPPDPGQTAEKQAGYNSKAAGETYDYATKGAGQTFDYSKQAADLNLRNNAMGRSGPAGSSQFIYGPNGLPIGINNSFDPSLEGAAGNIKGALGGQTGNLPSDVNFDMMTAPAIAAGNYGAYSAMTAPQRAQQVHALNILESERGLPLGDEADQRLRGNLYRGFDIADTNAAAQAWNAVPGMQSTMTNTAISQGMTPGNLAAQSSGLLGTMLGWLPQAQQPQGMVNGATVNGPNVGPVNYGDMAYKSFEGDQKNFQNMWSNIGNAGAAIGGMAFGMPPMGGGFGGNRGAGGGLFNGLFGNGGGQPGNQFPVGWNWGGNNNFAPGGGQGATAPLPWQQAAPVTGLAY